MKSWNLIFRRTHLYLGMLLIPWLIIYAVSTFFLNHRPHLGHGGPVDAQWDLLWEKEHTLDAPIQPDNLRATAAQILSANDIAGPFATGRQGQKLNINVQRFIRPIRLQYDIENHTLRAEKRRFSLSEVFLRMHFRTGYGRAGFLSNIWAIAVDLFSLTLLVWVGTGLYLWWKLSSTRRWGWAAIGAGAASFLILLLTL